MCDKMRKILDEEVKEAVEVAVKEAVEVAVKEADEKKTREIIENLISTTDWDDDRIAKVAGTTSEFVDMIRKGE